MAQGVFFLSYVPLSENTENFYLLGYCHPNFLYIFSFSCNDTESGTDPTGVFFFAHISLVYAIYLPSLSWNLILL